MKTRILITTFIVFSFLITQAFASHDPNQPQIHSIILPPDMIPPLKQLKSAISPLDIVCRDDYELVIKSSNGSPACVKPTTKVELILRGWAVDDREITGPAGADVSHLYPADKAEYRKLLENYYLKELDNGKEQFVKISLGEFKNVHSVGSPINDFIIKLEGYYPTYNSPDIKLEDEAGNIIWTNYDDIGHVYTSRVSSVEFCKEYRFYDIGDPLIINKTGTYKFIFSFEGFSIEKEIKIRENVSGVSIDSPAFHCP